jgi:hypothetical protein
LRFDVLGGADLFRNIDLNLGHLRRRHLHGQLHDTGTISAFILRQLVEDLVLVPVDNVTIILVAGDIEFAGLSGMALVSSANRILRSLRIRGVIPHEINTGRAVRLSRNDHEEEKKAQVDTVERHRRAGDGQVSAGIAGGARCLVR